MYVKLTGQRSVEIPKENGTTFSDLTGLTDRNGPCNLNSFPEFPNWGKDPVCQKWNGEFRLDHSDRNVWITSRGDPECSGQKKPKRTFLFEQFEFQPKFQESLA